MFSDFVQAALVVQSASNPETQLCRNTVVATTPYTICSVANTADIRLFLRDSSGEVYGDFDAVEAALERSGDRLIFAMNAGMYHTDRAPVGLYIEDSKAQSNLNTNPGPGNFHMLPNGVFWLWAEDGFRGAHVRASATYAKSAHDVVSYATQSGPMLVIAGQLHPTFNKGSANRRIRNGVGLDADGTLHFVKSERPVNFYDFASLFRDTLGTPNALYLDGTVSRLYAPSLGRNDEGLRMGPIVGLVAPIE
jgi:uncharacterized protein YigE (DUF2233 family)